MTNVTTAEKPPGGGAPARPAAPPASIASPNAYRLSGTFQVLVALYVLLTGTVPMIVQAAAFGLNGGAGGEFAVAMISETLRDVLLVAPLIALSRHPLGIFHPLILAVIVWPLISGMASTIQDFGGWVGVFAGVPVDPPYFTGIPFHFPPNLWMAVAKYNGILILALLSTYFGFAVARGGLDYSRASATTRNPSSIKSTMILLIAISTILLFLFVRVRGGLDSHLTSLGAGRFRELSSYGGVIFLIHIGTVALMVWIAALPKDVTSPLFLLAMVGVTAAEFIGNGSRSSALLVPMIVGLIWAIRRQKVPWKIAFLLAPAMFISLGLLGAVRTSSWYGSTAGQAFANTGWTESFADAQKEIAQRRADSASVPVVARGFSVTGGPLLGESYAAVVAAFIPRPLWKEKPRGAGALYARSFLGVPFSGTTIPLSPEAEMYWNFGLLGVLILSMIYGILLARVYHFYWRRYPDPFIIVFYVLFVTSFQFSTDRLVPLEQRLFLLFLCYVAVSVSIPKGRVADARPRGTPDRLPPGFQTRHSGPPSDLKS